MMQIINKQTSILHDVSKGFSVLNKTARAAMKLAQKIEDSFHIQQIETNEYFLRLELQTLYVTNYHESIILFH